VQPEIQGVEIKYFQSSLDAMSSIMLHTCIERPIKSNDLQQAVVDTIDTEYKNPVIQRIIVKVAT